MPNHLQHETSPYLLQHAENPVDWYPWGEEAFRRAREEDKPVFLSIGYSACHWCHVMAHESFEDPETAELLNRWFISVKVDREERPDLDSAYMAVCQAFTGNGGWPASIFLTPEEFIHLLSPERDGAFNRHFDITEAGNFEGKNISNQLQSNPEDRSFDGLLEAVYQYRRGRCSLRLDDKILTAWNGLMIAALCRLYQASENQTYLDAAKRADLFLWESLWDGESLHVSFRAGRRSEKGFLDDYAACIFAQLALYGATLELAYLEQAEKLCRETCERFQDREHGGFYLYSEEHEVLILRPKETYDGATPSGNSLMAWNLVRLNQLDSEERYGLLAEQQLDFLAADAAQYPAGHAMFLLALLDCRDPPPKVTVVCSEKSEAARILSPRQGYTAIT